MPDNPAIRKRRSMRLKGYDYTSCGAYFVTICASERQCLFGGIYGEIVRLNLAGQIVEAHWRDIPNHSQQVSLDEFVIMPNHIHGIVILAEVSMGQPKRVGTNNSPTNYYQINATVSANYSSLRPKGTIPGSLSAVIQSFKKCSTRRIRTLTNRPTMSVWQPPFYDHIIRDEAELERVREYIHLNPTRWAGDRENPEAAA